MFERIFGNKKKENKKHQVKFPEGKYPDGLKPKDVYNSKYSYKMADNLELNLYEVILNRAESLTTDHGLNKFERKIILDYFHEKYYTTSDKTTIEVNEALAAFSNYLESGTSKDSDKKSFATNLFKGEYKQKCLLDYFTSLLPIFIKEESLPFEPPVAKQLTRV